MRSPVSGLFLLLVAACTSQGDELGVDGGAKGDPDGGMLASTPDASPVAAAPSTAAQRAGLVGSYTVTSRITLGINLPQAAMALDEAFGGFASPVPMGSWLIDLMAEDPTLAPAIAPLRPQLDNGVSRISGQASNGTSAASVADTLRVRLESFMLEATLQISLREDGTLEASDDVWAITLHLHDGDEVLDPGIVNLGILRTDGVPITLDAKGLVTIGAHTLPLSYPNIVEYLLGDARDGITPFSQSYRQLIQLSYPCPAIAAYLTQLAGKDVDTWQTACGIAVETGIERLYAKMDALDGMTSSLELAGQVQAYDHNNDGLFDSLDDGFWNEVKLTVGDSVVLVGGPDQTLGGARSP